MIPSSQEFEGRSAPSAKGAWLADMVRPASGPKWNTGCPHLGVRIGCTISDQGSNRKLSIPIPTRDPIQRIKLYGVFSSIDKAARPTFGEIGVVFGLFDGERLVRRIELEYARHYVDSSDLSPKSLQAGDGCSLETLGAIEIDDRPYRLDKISVELADPSPLTNIEISIVQKGAILILFDTECEIAEAPKACPFHSSQKGVSLAELPAVVRVGDRAKLAQAIEQFRESVLKSRDIDEARGESLLFIAVLTSAFLERGADRSMHLVQLDLARSLDKLDSLVDVARHAHEVALRIADPLIKEPTNPTSQLMNDAMKFVDRHFAREISDDEISSLLGLSTSHFRHLFKETSGLPFHKYLVAVRLEHARRLLVETNASVTDAALAVGFQSPAHFSRAFTSRFGASPMQIRSKAG